MTETFSAKRAWLPGGRVADDVVIEVADGRIASVREGFAPPPDARTLPGVVLPGFANAHSHAFHRALRGRTHAGGGTFWTWRERMYALAAVLDPERYLELATAVYAEMVLAGVTCVGEFHYLHHNADGRPYGDPNAMGEALREAARRAGIRLTLLDACYLTGGIGQPLQGVQLRFGDGDVDRWSSRVAAMTPDEYTRIGVAIHSVRAVTPDGIERIAVAARSLGDATPVHTHVSEQPAENAACLGAYGVSPTRLLHDRGALSPTSTAVHATHLTADDIDLVGATRAFVCFCPTTERDLADGIGAARSLRDAGARLTLGSDQHAVIDLLEEARALEMDERLATLQRGRFAPVDLVAALTHQGHESLGWPDAGRLEPGARADFVAVRLDTVRTAGVKPSQVIFAATAADVDTVVVGGEVVVDGGQHRLGDIGQLLASSIGRLASAERR